MADALEKERQRSLREAVSGGPKPPPPRRDDKTRTPAGMSGVRADALSNVLRLAGDFGKGVGETALTMGTGMGAQALGGLRGVGDVLLGRGLDQAAQSARATTEDFTYAPRTDVAQRGLENVVAGIDTVAKPLRENVADPVGEFSPLLGAALVTAGEAVGPKGKPKVSALRTSEVRKALRAGKTGGESPTVRMPERLLNPGIYKRPEAIIESLRGSGKIEPESPMLKQLFGTTREELAALADQPGNITDPRQIIPGYPAKPRGTGHVERITTPRNAERIVSTIDLARRELPETYMGMKGWYKQDPMFRQMAEMMGEDEALKQFKLINRLEASESPMSSPVQEMRRAAAARYMMNKGPEAFDQWLRHGGLPPEARAKFDLLADVNTVPGRIGHVGIAPKLKAARDNPDAISGSRKTRPYELASSVEALGSQSSIPVGDTHFASMTGLSDVRPSDLKARGSVTTPEIVELAPWYQQQVAKPLGLQPVPAQAVPWGIFANETGVRAKVGPPKLELRAKLIEDYARATGQKPENVRNSFYAGKGHLGFIDPRLAVGITTLGAAGYGAKAMVEKLRERDKELEERMKEAERAMNRPRQAPAAQ